MKHLIISTLILLMTTSLWAQNDWEGTWEGNLNVGMQELRLVFHIKKGENNTWTALMDSPDQMAYDLKMDDVVIQKDKTISMSLKAAQAKFVGELSDDKQQINGEWIQGQSFPLELKKGKTKQLARPQEPQAPFPYSIEEVQYENKKAKIKLAGTLTIPEGNGKHPAVILISGSGPQDRDETILKHKPFWVLADYWTRNGFAVLRFDDRGVGSSEGDFSKATSADFATDVEAGFNFLKKHDRIDAKKIGLVGHSEGGMIAPMVASKNKGVAFIVLLAGPGVPGNELLIRQSHDIMKQQGLSDEAIEGTQKVTRKIYEAIIQDKKDELGVGDIVKMVRGDVELLDEETRKAVGLSEGALRQTVSTVHSPWMRYFIRYQPQAYLKKVKCPVLAINGEKDLQVAATPNLEAIEAALKMAKNQQVKTVAIPNLNHLFQTAETGAVDEYVKIEETFSPVAMELVLDWMKKQ
ncbi:alpha/beta fold hydrolase [Aureispira sp. CCB-E]|uniref:alpha/beta hydrolase family protein n=1 Tax=Aureispira sp. CCB-E TaxID=3051121 RepID=UPI0028687A34|nr:alpha/beta fold hydrolase [Aureispira sp. CCB-E]WMX14197.1 alpha/beta fold hydrolase [Aureispira sp. CCB-E]